MNPRSDIVTSIPRMAKLAPRCNFFGAAAPEPQPRKERPAAPASIGPMRPGGRGGGSSRPAPYERPAESERGGGGRGGGGKGGGEKGGGGKGKGKGKGGYDDAIARRAPPHVLRFEAAKMMSQGLAGSGRPTGGGMKEGRDTWSGRRAGEGSGSRL